MQNHKEIFENLKKIHKERNQVVYDLLVKHSTDMEIFLTEIMESAQIENNSVLANEAGSILQKIISDRLFAENFINTNDLNIY